MMTTLTITLCFSAVLAAYNALATKEQNGLLTISKGDNFTMECIAKDNKKDSLNIYARLPSKHVVAFYDKHTNNISLSKEYSKRVTVDGPIHKVTVMISDMKLEDSGLYIGIYSRFNYAKNEEEEEEGCSILLFVKDVTILTEKSTGKESPALSEPLVLVFALTACTMLVVFFLLVWVLLPKVKSHCMNQADGASRDHNPVYEDMHRVQKY